MKVRGAKKFIKYLFWRYFAYHIHRVRWIHFLYALAVIPAAVRTLLWASNPSLKRCQSLISCETIAVIVMLNPPKQNSKFVCGSYQSNKNSDRSTLSLHSLPCVPIVDVLRYNNNCGTLVLLHCLVKLFPVRVFLAAGCSINFTQRWSKILSGSDTWGQ